MAGARKQQKPTIAIVVSHFNEYLTRRLLDGCLDELKKSGIPSSSIPLAWVPGSFDIPVVAQKFAKKKNIDAVICLGVVVRGETYHFELVCQGAMRGIGDVALSTGKPVIFGVLSTETMEQAEKRSLPKGENKGRDAAQAALQMIETLRAI